MLQLALSDQLGELNLVFLLLAGKFWVICIVQCLSVFLDQLTESVCVVQCVGITPGNRHLSEKCHALPYGEGG